MAEHDYTGSYSTPDDAPLAVPYSFRGSLMGEEELAAVRRVVENAETLTAGPEVQQFEREYAGAFDSNHAFATSSCTSALFLAYDLAGVGAGDEVIAPPLTFVASVLPALHRGARVVFADVDARTLNLDPEAVRAAITPKTRAIVVVHYAGQLAQMEALRAIADEHGIALIEDAAHAVGARRNGRAAGSWGDFGCFSFHSLKNMSTLGEGGMLTVAAEQHARRVPELRSMGLRSYTDQTDYWLPYHYDVVETGWNARMSEVAAAVGRVQLRRLDEFHTRRRAIAARLNEGLKDVAGIATPHVAPGNDHVYHLYTLLLEDGGAQERDRVVRHCFREYGVQAILHYLPLNRFTRFAEFDRADCPVAERAFSRLFNLPIHPALTDEQVDRMIEAVRTA